MKRLLVCLVMGATLLAQGCAPDPYAVERSYWNITRQAKRVFDNPQGSPPGEVNRVIMLLRDFARSNPKNKLAVEAEFNVAHLFFAKNDYDRAREQLKAMLERYGKYQGIGSEVRFLIGVSYQRQSKLEAATQEFSKLLSEYPQSSRAFMVPFYLVRYYTTQKMTSEAAKALKQALTFYKDTASRTAGSKQEFTADLFIARCYIETKEWKTAAREFDRVYEKYRSRDLNMEGVLFNLAFIYLKELKDEAKARQTLAILLKEYPQSSYITTAQDLVKKMNRVEK